MSKVQTKISCWLIALWCLGVLSPTIFYFVVTFIIQPHFGLPDHIWLGLTLLAGFSVSACATTFMQLSMSKRIGLVLLAALLIAIQFAAIVIFYVSSFPTPT